jgi:DNA-binding XRE family transcriptional regulator
MIKAAQIKPKTPRIPEGDYVPHEVVGLHIERDITYLRAWREYLGLTQDEVAERAGITQAALSQMESGEARLRKASREKLALAMGLNPGQLI